VPVRRHQLTLTKLGFDALALIVSATEIAATEGLYFGAFVEAGVAGTAVFYDLVADDETLASQQLWETTVKPASLARSPSHRPIRRSWR
jgi:hypothetical protein